MLFNSPVFLFLFLPIAFFGHWIVPRQLRNTILLIFSLIFYWWGGSQVIFILFSSILINWLFGLGIGFTHSYLKGFMVGLGVSINLLILAYYKYANDFIFPLLGLKTLTVHGFVIPLGISFYTFHSISYLVDVFRSLKKPFLNPINFGLYVCLFPQLVAGPIVRFGDISSQIEERHFDLYRISSGCERFIFGLAKKMLLADNMAPVADQVFNLSRIQLSTSSAWLGIIAFTLQIYYDFSGYSDMAIGLARMFGFELLENFNYPYFSDSITDFWHRWHLSLSAWFRDYLYIPLGGSRVSTIRIYFNLLTVFVLCGLWHGPSFNFIIWGIYNGAFLIFERAVDLKHYLPKLPRHLYAIVVVMFGWVIFRTHSPRDFSHYIGVLVGIHPSPHLFANGLGLLLTPRFFFIMVLAIILAFPCFTFMASDFQQRRYPNKTTRLDWSPNWLIAMVVARPVLFSVSRASVCLLLWIVCAAQITVSTAHSFIYFNF